MSLDKTNIQSKLFDQEKVSETKVWLRNVFLSIIIHIILFTVLILFYKYNQNKAMINPEYFYIETKQYEKKSDIIKDELANDKIEQDITNTPNLNTEEKYTQFVSLSNLEADTTNLDQIYKEPTLNLSIKYPKGWTFVDQNKNKKLDGVTFWAADGLYSPPPYIHLEVIDKYLFNEKRYKYKTELNNCIAFFNDPEELAEQVTQVFYLRTDTDEDFILKLIINGMQEFNSFQPRFLAILKSFHFGNSLF